MIASGTGVRIDERQCLCSEDTMVSDYISKLFGTLLVRPIQGHFASSSSPSAHADWTSGKLGESHTPSPREQPQT